LSDWLQNLSKPNEIAIPATEKLHGLYCDCRDSLIPAGSRIRIEVFTDLLIEISGHGKRGAAI
jgi:hypothetical protein